MVYGSTTCNDGVPHAFQEEKAARLSAEKRLASVMQAQQGVDAYQPVMGNGVPESLGLRTAVEADLLLAREGLEHLCQALQGMSQEYWNLETLANPTNTEALQHALDVSTFGVPV